MRVDSFKYLVIIGSVDDCFSRKYYIRRKYNKYIVGIGSINGEFLKSALYEIIIL